MSDEDHEDGNTKPPPTNKPEGKPKEDTNGNEEDDDKSVDIYNNIPESVDDALQAAITILKCANKGKAFKTSALNSDITVVNKKDPKPVWKCLKNKANLENVNVEFVNLFFAMLQSDQAPDHLVAVIMRSLGVAVRLFTITYAPQFKDIVEGQVQFVKVPDSKK